MTRRVHPTVGIPHKARLARRWLDRWTYIYLHTAPRAGLAAAKRAVWNSLDRTYRVSSGEREGAREVTPEFIVSLFISRALILGPDTRMNFAIKFYKFPFFTDDTSAADISTIRSLTSRVLLSYPSPPPPIFRQLAACRAILTDINIAGIHYTYARE